MNPSTLSYLPTIKIRFLFPYLFSAGTSYPLMAPQQIIYPPTAMCSKAMSRVSPPTLSKYMSIPSGENSFSFYLTSSVL
jgi:hypothetical protein